ncbi:MAG: N-acetyltransferase family protein [Planctomycetes bacterium]|nr:N-acetyltransferase family protein [Planctomycetota bacterium]
MSVSLRAATEADAAACAKLYAPYVRDTCVTFELEAPAQEEMAHRIREYSKHAPWLLAVDEARQVLGYAYGSRYRARPAYDWTAEVTVYVAHAAQRRGIGRALYRALLDLMRLQGFHSALGVISLPNDASIALHEALGFEPVGVLRAAGHKHGAWHDTGLWQCRLGITGAAPIPLRGAAEVLASGRGRAVLERERLRTHS